MPVSQKDVPISGGGHARNSVSPLSAAPTSCVGYCLSEHVVTHAACSGDDHHQHHSGCSGAGAIQIENACPGAAYQCRRPTSSSSPISVLSATGNDYHFFNTHSPPLLNLSPNLSPAASDIQLLSPCYDLRESTKRQSNLYGRFLAFFSCERRNNQS